MARKPAKRERLRRVVDTILARDRYLSVPFTTDPQSLRPACRIYRYNSNLGYYEPKVRPEITAMIEDMENGAAISFCNEVLATIERRTAVDPQKVDPPGYLNLMNGVLDLETRTLHPHSPSWYFTKQLPIIYRPDADCPRFRRFLSEIVDEEYTIVLQEMLGFILLEEYRFHKAYLLVGRGRNGKTTLLRTIQTLLGDRWTAVTLQDLCENRFAAASLYGCLANICDDMPSDAVRYTGKFKMLCGESPMVVERKYADLTTFMNTAKLIFTCNQVPPAHSADDAYFDRWIIVPFPNTFRGSNCNPNMVEELTTPRELAGILNLALDMRDRLKQQSELTIPDDGLSPRARYNQYIGGESITLFLARFVREDDSGIVTRNELYQAYLDFCDLIEELPRDSRAFFRELRESYPNALDYRPRTGDGRVRIIKGLRLTYNQKHLTKEANGAIL